MVLVVPRGRELRSIKPFLDEYRERPERIETTAVLTDSDSFIDYTNRFKLPNSVIFADSEKCTLTTVVDFHKDQATPEFGYHQAKYECPRSDAWEKWEEFCGQPHNQEAMAAFIEDRIMDIGVVDVDAPQYAAALEIGEKLHKEYAMPNQLLTLSTKLSVTVKMQVKQSVNRQSGERALVFVEEHEPDENVVVPGLFLLSIEVFRDGAIHHIPARLRYRVANNAISWAVELYRPDLALKEAFDKVCLEAQEATELPLYRGMQEDPSDEDEDDD
jgi:uncharacterized protein YfdQ (DUF2303 family)